MVCAVRGAWHVAYHDRVGTSHLAMVALDNHVYALGGIRRTNQGAQKSSTCVERFDPQTKKWEKIASLQVVRCTDPVTPWLHTVTHTEQVVETRTLEET